MSADLREDLRAYLDEIVDRIDVEARNPAASAERHQVPSETTRRGSSHTRWLAAAAVVILAFATVVVAVRSTQDPAEIDVVGPVSVSSTAPAPPEVEPEPGVPSLEATDLADGPFANLATTAAVWTGSELILWRGEHNSGPSDAPTDRAASFDLETNQWTLLPPDPLGEAETPNGADGAFIDGEALFWSSDDLVGWNPQTETWRRLAAAPHVRSWTAASTGTELLFPFDGLAFDPATNTWRETSSPDVDLWPDRAGLPSVLWTGTALVAVTSRAGIYDPATDTWRTIQPPEPEVQPGTYSYAPTLYVIDGRVVAETGPGEAVALNFETGEWSPVAELAPPIPSCEGQPAIKPFAQNNLFATTCQVSAWRPPGGPWQEISAFGWPIGTEQGLLLYGLGPNRNGLQLLKVVGQTAETGVDQSIDRPPSSTDPPQLELTPAGPYIDQQEVTVHGTGFDPGKLDGLIGQCPADLDTAVNEQCGYWNFDSPVVVGADGAFTMTFRLFATGPLGADCTQAPGCVLAWVPPRRSFVASVPLEFAS